MKKLHTFCLVLLLILLLALASVLGFLLWRSESARRERKNPAIPAHKLQYHREMVDKINRAGTSWTAVYNKFALEAESHILTGSEVLSEEEHMLQYGKILKKVFPELINTTTDHINGLLNFGTKPIPVEFDPRVRWPNCASLHRVPNQGSCGCCWAIAASNVISDRICIQSNGSQQPEISTQDILTCAKPSGGCHGGMEIVPYWTWVNDGLVTGGPFGSNEGCRPFTIPNDCGAPCDWVRYTNTPECLRKCHSLYQKTYEQDKYYGKNVYSFDIYKLFVDHLPEEAFVELVQREIQTNGPVQASFMVSEDFQHYHSGVYIHVTGKYMLSHSVRLLGWGETKEKVPYWIAVNSFGRNWGQNGIFWLHRNCSLISVTAAMYDHGPL